MEVNNRTIIRLATVQTIGILTYILSDLLFIEKLLNTVCDLVKSVNKSTTLITVLMIGLALVNLFLISIFVINTIKVNTKYRNLGNMYVENESNFKRIKDSFLSVKNESSFDINSLHLLDVIFRLFCTLLNGVIVYKNINKLIALNESDMTNKLMKTISTLDLSEEATEFSNKFIELSNMLTIGTIIGLVINIIAVVVSLIYIKYYQRLLAIDVETVDRYHSAKNYY